MGPTERNYFKPGDQVSFLSLAISPDGTSDLEEVARHRFSSDPEPVMAPETTTHPAWAFTGYTIAGDGAISSFVDVKTSDRVMNWGLDTYPELLSDLEADNLFAHGFYGRCNDTRNLCVGEHDGRMLYWDGHSFSDLGTVEAMFERAQAAGY
jgi:hypothetical protein